MRSIPTASCHEDHERRAETSHSRISIHTAEEQHEQDECVKTKSDLLHEILTPPHFSRVIARTVGILQNCLWRT